MESKSTTVNIDDVSTEKSATHAASDSSRTVLMNDIEIDADRIKHHLTRKPDGNTATNGQSARVA